MSHSIKLYGMIIVKEAQRFFTYRVNIFSGILSAFFMIAARYALWAALFATGNGQGSSLRETMTYLVINDMLLMWMAVSFSGSIGSDISSGNIAQRLIKPYPYHLQLMAGFHASAFARTLTHALPMLLIALFWIGLLPPVSMAALGLFLLSALLGGVIYALVDLIISYSAFWLTAHWYISWFRRGLFVLFGGTMLPLWFYPDWLASLCAFLPFQYAVFQPIAIYLGRVDSANILLTVGIQIFWIALLFVLERAIWRVVQFKIVVQGG